MISDDVLEEFINSTNLIDLRTNFISLQYDDKERDGGSYVHTLQGNLFLTDFRLSLRLFIVNNTDPNITISYISFGYITFNKK